MRSKIFISGSIARDLIMDFPGRFAEHIDPKKIHILNLSFAVENLKESIGGTAANICYNLALLGEKPEIVGSIGTDVRGFLSYFKKLGIGTKYLKISKQRTAGAYIITDKDDNQIAGFHVGAMAEPVKLPEVKAGDWAIIAPENPKNMVKLARYYQRKKANYIFDPGQAVTALTKRDLETCLRGALVLIGNDYEIGLVESLLRGSAKGGDEAIPAVMRLLRYARNDIIIVRTFGPKGSEILSAGRKIRIGIAKPRQVIDPTGTGDAYRAGFLKGLILGYNLKDAGQLGATVASFAVEKYGTQNHKFTANSVKSRFFENFKQLL